MHLKKFIKENFVLATGIGLPVLLVIFFVLFSLVPRWMTPAPQHDLLFASKSYEANDNPYILEFFIDKNQLRAKKVAQSERIKGRFPQHKLFIYDIDTQSMQELLYEVPENGSTFTVGPEGLSFVAGTKSPDGYVFDGYQYIPGSLAMDVFMGGSRGEKARVRKGGAVYRIAPESLQHMQFIGWVVKGKKHAE